MNTAVCDDQLADSLRSNITQYVNAFYAQASRKTEAADVGEIDFEQNHVTMGTDDSGNRVVVISPGPAKRGGGGRGIARLAPALVGAGVVVLSSLVGSMLGP